MRVEKSEFLGKGCDPAEQTDLIIGVAKLPLTVKLTNVMARPLVLAQASPAVMLQSGESIEHLCHTRGHVYDLVFGMVAVGDQLEQEKIGSVIVIKPTKGASK
jgi:hypothetical protein